MKIGGNMVRIRYSFGSRHTGRITNIKKQRGKYPDVMKDVVRISDIVLEILDARYIEETRNREVEDDILKKGKVLVYVFNKADLVDVKDLEKHIPSWMRPYVFVSATKGIGLSKIKGLIKMESKRILRNRIKRSPRDDSGEPDAKRIMAARKGKDKKDDKSIVKDLRGAKRVHVGVIGYPNAGKSSVINFITRRGVAKTAKQAGFTKGMQKIRMSLGRKSAYPRGGSKGAGIVILDTPGVIPASKYSTESKSFARDVKVGGRTYSDVKDPEDVVFYIMSPRDDSGEPNDNAGKIERFYGIDAKGSAEDLIEELGLKKGYLKKGGKVDVDRSARLILRDWQEGNIQ
jgi:ribosome biogenesis GTPase A